MILYVHYSFAIYLHHRECHITPDLLLIYKLEGEKLILVRTGSHSELFE
jgi:mRNA interferase YafQ